MHLKLQCGIASTAGIARSIYSHPEYRWIVIEDFVRLKHARENIIQEGIEQLREIYGQLQRHMEINH